MIPRAAELQASEPDIGVGVTKEEVLALGQDVGIAQCDLQRARLEEQTRTIRPLGIIPPRPEAVAKVIRKLGPR